MSGLKAAANQPNHPFQPDQIVQALRDTEAFEIGIEATPWADVRRAWELAKGSLRYADALYVAAAERYESVLLTVDGRIGRSGALVRYEIITVDRPRFAPPRQRDNAEQ